MVIDKILLFDDRKKVIREGKHVKKIKEMICRALGNRNLGIETAKNIYVEEYLILGKDDEGKAIQGKMTEDGEKPINWMSVLDEIEFNKSLVICDFYWDILNQDNVLERIYNQIKDNEAVIFACYSTVLYEEAQDWVDDICKQPHQCKVIKEVFTADNDPTDYVVSLEEAILYAWEKV